MYTYLWLCKQYGHLTQSVLVTDTGLIPVMGKEGQGGGGGSWRWVGGGGGEISPYTKDSWENPSLPALRALAITTVLWVLAVVAERSYGTCRVPSDLLLLFSHTQREGGERG